MNDVLIERTTKDWRKWNFPYDIWHDTYEETTKFDRQCFADRCDENYASGLWAA